MVFLLWIPDDRGGLQTCQFSQSGFEESSAGHPNLNLGCFLLELLGKYFQLFFNDFSISDRMMSPII
jgi:hypothetical protein